MSIKFARTLRRNTTDAERQLWKLLRSRNLNNWKFRRQHHIGNYIADFVCVETRLVVEADGGQHYESASDATRTDWLEQHGWHVLRFWNNEILSNPEGVLKILDGYLANYPLPNGRGWAPTRKRREGEGVTTLSNLAPSPGSLRSPTSPVKGEVTMLEGKWG